MVQSLTNKVIVRSLRWRLRSDSGSQCGCDLMEELYNMLHSLCSTVTCCGYYKVWFCWKAMKDKQILWTSVYSRGTAVNCATSTMAKTDKAAMIILSACNIDIRYSTFILFISYSVTNSKPVVSVTCCRILLQRERAASYWHANDPLGTNNGQGEGWGKGDKKRRKISGFENR